MSRSNDSHVIMWTGPNRRGFRGSLFTRTCVVVMRRLQSNPAMKREYQWAISLIRQYGKFLVGYVGAPDAETAIQEAINRFGITDPEQQTRLIAQRSA